MNQKTIFDSKDFSEVKREYEKICKGFANKEPHVQPGGMFSKLSIYIPYSIAKSTNSTSLIQKI